MGIFDKFRNKSEMGKGRVKQKAGRAVGNPSLDTKGKNERVGGAARQVTEQAKDAGKNIRKGFKS